MKMGDSLSLSLTHTKQSLRPKTTILLIACTSNILFLFFLIVFKNSEQKNLSRDYVLWACKFSLFSCTLCVSMRCTSLDVKKKRVLDPGNQDSGAISEIHQKRDMRPFLTAKKKSGRKQTN